MQFSEYPDGGPMRKYATEFAVNVIGNAVLLTQQQNLNVTETTEFINRFGDTPCNIYMVCRRPRICIDPDSFSKTDHTISLDFLVQRQAEYLRFPSSSPHEYGSLALHCESTYPFTYFRLCQANGSKVFGGSAAVMAGHIGPENIQSFLDLEVLYVGQSFGKYGTRQAQDRLLDHSTLQTIYSEAITAYPDQEVWLMLWSLSWQMITSIDGRWNQYEASNEEDEAHASKVASQEFTAQQMINFTEAAMIRYFQPRFNVKYKNKFPSPAHATYPECYDMDLNSLVVEMNTEDMMARLYTESVKSEWHHIAHYNFHSKEERRDMFTALVPEKWSK